MAKSTLELLLDSIKERDEAPPDKLPVLPQRPPSRARLPSAVRMRKMPDADTLLPAITKSNGHVRPSAHRAEIQSTRASFPIRHQDDAPASRLETGMEVAPLAAAEEDAMAKRRRLDETEVERMVDGRGEAITGENGRGEAITEENLPMLNTGNSHIDRVTLRLHNLPSSTQGDLVTNKRKRRRDGVIHKMRKESRVWFLHEANKWVLGVIKSHSDDISLVNTLDGQVFSIPYNKLLPANPEILDGVDDLVQLSYVNEPATSHNLRLRYDQDKIYTRAGPVLLAVNPFKEVNNNQLLEQYSSVNGPSSAPHIFSTVETAVRDLVRDGINQSLITSGESGAGKTESAKLMLQYLVASRGNNAEGNNIIQSEIILEAFGNAKTANNANANRFGKLVNVYFQDDGKISGANFQTVFFDKSRVVHRAEGEKSYHIFYQLCEGANSSLKEELHLRSSEEFNYLKWSGHSERDCVDYHDQFQSLLNAFTCLGITGKEQKTIFSMLATILWIGNINFSLLKEDDKQSFLENNEAIKKAAQLLQCSGEQLLGAICGVSADEDDLKYSSSQVIAARDFLAEFLYEKAFMWLVARINASLKKESDGDLRRISILDFPGFGSSEKNGLEQLFINYAHETLQDYIYHPLLQQEQEACICEGTEFPQEDSRTDDSLSFCEKHLFPVLEEESAKLDGTNCSFIKSMEVQIADFRKKSSLLFDISHASGKVTYDATGFVERNRGSVRCEVMEFVSICMGLLPTLSCVEDDQLFGKVLPAERVSNSRCKAFQTQLLQIMRQIDNTTLHVILCIKPNGSQMASSYVEELVLKQLRSCGLLDVIRVAKCGYPVQISQEHFASRFGLLLTQSDLKNQNILEVCVAVLQNHNISPQMYQVGLSKIFFRSGQIDQLEQAREKLLEKVVCLQRCYRGFKVRLQLKRNNRAVTLLQALARGWLTRKVFQRVESGREAGIPMKRFGDVVMESKTGVMPDKCTQNKHTQIPAPEELKIMQDEKEKQERALRFEEMQARAQAAEAALDKKDQENALLQEQLKEYERRWSEYESKMKSMEEMWQKQLHALQSSLASGGAKDMASREHVNQISKQSNDPQMSLLEQGSKQEASKSSPQKPLPQDVPAAPDRSELDSTRSVLDHLTKEFEHRTQVFNDDADFLVEVKSGQIEANFKPDEELHKLKQRFEVWKKDFKARLRETKGLLKKLGKSESAEKSKKRWWAKKSS